ncbi:unnamed protein product [Commensalibacter communis]|uniref:Uncharacterized protein n=1 Tax=Commensalibacter communis TaxID=2972786 RepID=A0A9W4XDZ6_9PROT|nr:DUF6290 family protein [Commensalibacter communis]CAI3955428.1 unnamed protein product [Commensalibacter communis]CAI3957594.1 unnamed protein product [Commensalibacter communis]CAI3958244.1 unnamed protein product [Commensalibacter communis]CAI3959436.1 unnamed protein product [Commensalibacter communis]
MSMLNIRIDDNIKSELQEIAKLKNISLSSLVLSAVNEMVENEFDYNLAEMADKRRKSNELNFDIEDLYQEFGV